MMAHHSLGQPRMSSVPAPDDNRLIWIDLEMTGLDPDTDSIIEIATLVTDQNLQHPRRRPRVGHPPSDRAPGGDGRLEPAHAPASGLWDRVLASDVTLAQAEARTIEFLSHWVPPNKSPICGNSICQDRRFLVRLMPRLEKLFPLSQPRRQHAQGTGATLVAGAVGGLQQVGQPHRARRHPRVGQ